MNVLALLTCFNRKSMTVRCIESLEADKNINFKYIVVDDNSTDGTKEELSKFKNVHVVSGNGSSFYSGGMRIAINEANKYDLSNIDYIILLNDDVKFEYNAISNLIKYLDNKNSIMVGATCDSNGVLSYGGVIPKSRFKPEYEIIMSNNEPLVCDTFNANCVLIPKDIFVNLDNIDEMYTHAMGDFDYGYEATRKGYEILVSNFFVGECNDNDISTTWRDNTLNTLERLKRKESIKGLPFKTWFYYLKKNHNILTAIIYSLTPYLRIILHK